MQKPFLFIFQYSWKAFKSAVFFVYIHKQTYIWLQKLLQRPLLDQSGRGCTLNTNSILLYTFLISVLYLSTDYSIVHKLVILFADDFFKDFWDALQILITNNSVFFITLCADKLLKHYVQPFKLIKILSKFFTLIMVWRHITCKWIITYNLRF